MAAITNMPGNLFEATLYPVGPLSLLLQSADSTQLPNLTVRPVTINPQTKKRVALTVSGFTLERIGSDNRAYELTFPDVGTLADNATTSGGFHVEFVSEFNEVVCRGSFTFDASTRTNDEDFETVPIIIDNTQLVINVSLPIRSGTGGGGGGAVFASLAAFAASGITTGIATYTDNGITWTGRVSGDTFTPFIESDSFAIR